jgi:hypothetical protein
VVEAVGDVVSVVGAVGGVGIHQQVRPPAREHLRQQGAHLDGLGLEVVAVEVQPGGRGTPAHLLGAVLVDAIVRAAALVGVGGEKRRDEQHDPVEQRLARAQRRGVAQQGEHGVLALALARVDAALHEHDRLAEAPRRLGREGPVLGDDHQRQVAPLGRGAVARDLDPARGPLEPAQVAHGLVVGGRAPVARGLGGREPLGRRGRRRGRGAGGGQGGAQDQQRGRGGKTARWVHGDGRIARGRRPTALPKLGAFPLGAAAPRP